MAVTKLTIYNKALSMTGSRRLATTSDDVEEQEIVTAVYDDCRDSALEEHMWSFAQKRVALIDMTAPSADLWVTATAYAIDDEVLYGGVYYVCLVAHTSDTFSGDLVSLDWETNTSWVTDTPYALGDKVYHSGVAYSCLVVHTSGTFATDLTSVDWIVAEAIALTADGMSNVFYKPTDCLKVNMFNNTDAQIKLEEQRVLASVSTLSMVYTFQNDTPSTYSSQFRDALANLIAAETCFSLTESVSRAEALFDKYTKITLPKAISIDSQQGTPLDAQADQWERARGTGGSGYATHPGGSNVWHPY